MGLFNFEFTARPTYVEAFGTLRKIGQGACTYVGAVGTTKGRYLRAYVAWTTSSM